MAQPKQASGLVAGALAAAMSVAALPAAANDVKGADCLFSERVIPTNAAFQKSDYDSLTNRQLAEMGVKLGNYYESPEGGVGVMIVMSDDLIGKVASSGNELTPEYMASVFQSAFDQQGVPTMICYGYKRDFNATSVSFGTREWSKTGLSPVAALRIIEEVANKYKGQNGLASLPLAPPPEPAG
ncbi:MAG: hypothetical protein ACRBCT_01180 [Alphaproteobacteria bacterium]